MGHATNLIVVAGATVAVQVEGKSAGTGVATKLCQSTSGVYLDCVATPACAFSACLAAWQENVRPKMYVQLGE
ncbi:hypothetical protein MTP99_001251 [Tenebrio molitor]|nr:hypothetical protein MTP99_001251 [Tenebrio molitor]